MWIEDGSFSFGDRTLFETELDYYSEMYTVESQKSDWTEGFKEFKKKIQK